MGSLLRDFLFMNTKPREDRAGVAIYPFNKEIFGDQHLPGDLSFVSGDVIRNITQNPSGWSEGYLNGVKGTFPSEYVAMTFQGRGKCTHNFTAGRSDELSIHAGDEVDVYERRKSGWVRVICNGKGGLVPGTYIQEAGATSSMKIPSAKNTHLAASKSLSSSPQRSHPPPPATTGPPPPPATMGPPPMPNAGPGGPLKPIHKPQSNLAKSSPMMHKKVVSPPAPAPPVQESSYPKAKVLFSYSAQHPGDLELVVGTIIEVTKSEGGWWEGLYNGSKGIFPANYVEKL